MSLSKKGTGMVEKAAYVCYPWWQATLNDHSLIPAAFGGNSVLAEVCIYSLPGSRSDKAKAAAKESSYLTTRK